MAKKCPKERFSYLRELVTEFQDTSSPEAKEQVLANLSNFAYDPQNYEHFKQLNIVNLFVDHLDDSNEKVVEFAIGGLCNIVLDKDIKETVLRRGGVDKVIKCLSSSGEETVLSAITTLMFLVTPSSKQDVTKASVIDCMLRFSVSSNNRLRNLASVFLQDYCTLQQMQTAKALAAAHEQESVPSANRSLPC